MAEAPHRSAPWEIARAVVKAQQLDGAVVIVIHDGIAQIGACGVSADALGPVLCMFTAAIDAGEKVFAVGSRKGKYVLDGTAFPTHLSRA